VTSEERAEALMVEARDRLVRGEVTEAGELLDQVAAIWRDEGNAVEEARALRLAASLARHEGRLDDAAMRAALAVTIAPEGQPQAAAEAEQARVAAAEGNLALAVAAWQRAVETADEDELPLYLDELGSSLAQIGQAADAAAAFRRERDVLAAAGQSARAARSLLSGTTALQAAGDRPLAEELSAEAEQAATETGDHDALAQLALLASARAVEARDLAEARAQAEHARAESLLARSPLTYVGAAIALAQMAEAAGDRLDAYASLAKGWATLSDLLGRDEARGAFEPALLDLKTRWGDDAFAAVKAEYEATRRTP
jgi:tetratricopeptide (TPR) repeat protein